MVERFLSQCSPVLSGFSVVVKQDFTSTDAEAWDAFLEKFAEANLEKVRGYVV